MLLKGSILSIAVLSSAFVVFNILEYYGRFDTPVRIVFFFSYILAGLFILFLWIIRPVYRIFISGEQMSDEEASRQVGMYFPEISDKLLNTFQLSRLSSKENELLEASIAQKSKELSYVRFADAVNLSENKRRARILIIPFTVIFLILMFVPQLFVEGTKRIVQFNTQFTYPAPFDFIVKNEKLNAFKNEGFEVQLRIEGKVIPENVYLVSNGKKSKMRRASIGEFLFDFKNLQKSEEFLFEAAGYNSKNYKLNVLSRPDLRSFEAFLKYPSYLGKKPESLKNAGNLNIPEGTEITWSFNAVDAEKINLKFSNESFFISEGDKGFVFTRKAKKSENYEIELENKFSKSREKISYYLNVIPDEFPSINVEQYQDTVLFNFISLGGTLSDDYGINALKLFYRIVKDEKDETRFQSLSIPTEKNSPTQNFFFNWRMDSLNLKPGENIEYYLQVWDNDGVNGNKSSRTGNFKFRLPGKDEIKEQISEASDNAEKKIDQTLKKSQELHNEIVKLENRLKTKNNLNWQDKKMLEELLKKHDELKKDLEEMRKLNESLKEKNEKFNNINPETAQKLEQLQKLMDNLLDDETKKLFEELNKLLQQQENKLDIQKILEELRKNENLEKELDRALEMFRQLQFEQKLNEVIEDLKKLSEEQEKLSEQTEQKKESNEKLSEEQEKLNKEFENLKEELKDLKNINESLENKKNMENTSEKENQIDQEMQKSSEQLKNNQNSKAGKSQKNASDKMKQMAEQLEKMQSQMQAQEAEENMDDLRDILENLITLSFDQEDLMKEFRKVNHSDPRYITLTQKQLKLIDDSKIIEDSLMALAKRVFQIQSFVTREVGEMKSGMEESMQALRNRRVDIATGKQQHAMTSINNLALMLNDVLKQMQEQMNQNMMMCSGKGCKKPGKNKPGMGDLGELQKQLNEKISKLKESGKTGRALSEELAKLTAEQELLRNALKELQKNGAGGKASDELKKLEKQMEETEKDLVNKQLTQELINRQKEILTRLLEAEKSMREQGEEERREAEKPKEVKKDIPPSFEKYLKAKEKEVDLLKTIPPGLTPYYKQEVNEYFQKIEK